MLVGYESRAAFFVCWVPAMRECQSAAFAIVDNFDWLINIKNSIRISEGFHGEAEINPLDECVFTGRLIIYVEGDFPLEARASLVQRGRSRNLSIILRDREYMKRKEQRSQPMAFLSYDSL